ncbi:TIGR04282 family arsenosugar biosynthesis glycosyltransferase [Nucisporomicrobium flavum]|uniref:TIGR04282 family arsenosugar biosynthesis glycosyltransferase n=1 Tax=Nucisporomicrobium flavum TaxID=2785915 RepID=UPI003C2EA9F8
MTQFLVLAKAPVPGRVKTRLCPPWTYEQAAQVAAAALSDTLVTVGSAPAASRTLVVDGSYPAPPGWQTLPQRGGPLSDRLTGAFSDAGGDSAVLLGMDTPQVTADMLEDAGDYAGADATLGLAEDGGWWTLGLRNRSHAEVLRKIPTSTDRTGQLTLAALRDRGLRVRLLPVLRDVDTVADARSVATLCRPESSFRAAVEALRHEC